MMQSYADPNPIILDDLVEEPAVDRMGRPITGITTTESLPAIAGKAVKPEEQADAPEPVASPEYTSTDIEDVPYELEKIPNVLVNTLVEDYDGDPEDTACLFLMNFIYEDEEYGVTVVAPETNLEVRPEVEAALIEQLTEQHRSITE